MIFQTLALLILLVTLPHVSQVLGYVPAVPSNITIQGASAANASRLHVQWHMDGSDWEYVTRQLVGPEASNDPVQGVFVHFTEDSAGNETTTTPWIAFVSCDANSTNSSQEADVFTMAKDRGAKSVVLYSLYAETCVITTAYQSAVLDVFTIQTLNAAWHIEYEFGQFGPSSGAYYGYFNATMLNNVAGVINNTLASQHPAAPGFLFATLLVNDANGTELQSDTNTTGTSTSTDSSGSQNTGVAMIVLYTITGCVSALFSAVIISGAIRAIRYPERYGPRTADPTLGGGQSRARGLGRAILDTFPIVKFGSSGNDRRSGPPPPKDIESPPIGTESSAPMPLPDSVQLTQLNVTAEHDDHHHDPWEGGAASTADQQAQDNRGSEGTDQVGLQPQTHTGDYEASSVPASPYDTGMPESIGRETCPICIVDFEEGDDLRVLPCEGKHRFHQSCVDPWLLELSGSCPICRQDFHALETIISGEPGSEASPVNRHSGADTQNRFSRYLRFTRRRQARPGSMSLPPPPESRT